MSTDSSESRELNTTYLASLLIRLVTGPSRIATARSSLAKTNRVDGLHRESLVAPHPS